MRNFESIEDEMYNKALGRVNLTKNEKIIMHSGCESDFDNFCEFGTWVFDVIDKSKLDPKVARGVISSLVKKGLVVVEDQEGRGNSNDMAIIATKEGVKVCAELGYNTVS